jgi:hypothetical protein
MNMKASFEKYEALIPLGLFLLFLAFTLPGISWGAPDTWHPDEIAIRSINALEDPAYRFDETNFDYPTLPQYVIFGFGRLILRLRYDLDNILFAARVLSAAISGLTVVVAYFIARRVGGTVYVAGLSGLLLIGTTLLPHNARFAHNDPYITIFTTLTILFLVNYKRTNERGWLYASFFAVGLAASSKYNGIALFLAPLTIYLARRRHSLFRLRVFETLFIGGALTYLGFALGTPKALTWMVYYFKRMIPALLHTGNYLLQPDSVRGYIGQYAVLANGLGFFLFLLFTAGFIWAVMRVLRKGKLPVTEKYEHTDLLVIPLLAILAMDLPIMASYNYQPRFFLPLMPPLAITAAFFVENLFIHAKQRNVWLVRSSSAALALIVLYSFARNISVALLFANDARFAATEYVNALPAGASLEHTLYPPSIPLEHFEREHNYPIFFIKVPGDPVPSSKLFEYNTGEAGLDARNTTYLVTDSFTYDRFNDPYICASVQVECNFFKRLNSGQSKRYKLIAEFSYSLPRFLPQITVQFVNPVIRIYERIK